MRELLSEFWLQLQNLVDWLFRIVALVWTWSVEQIVALPWADLGGLPLWKLLLLIGVGVVVVALVFWTLYALFSVGAHLIAAVATLFAALVRTVPAVAAAGLIAAGAAYVINNVDSLPGEERVSLAPSELAEPKAETQRLPQAEPPESPVRAVPQTQ
jgi:hypothetical protein